MKISAIVIGLLCSVCCSAQHSSTTAADDQNNWAALLKVINASTSDGRSGNNDLDVFGRILRANAIERATGRSGSHEFLFQGDILLGKSKIDDILNSTGSLRRKRAVSKKTSTNLWERNKIAYTLDKSLGTKAILAIEKAIKEWAATLSCLGKWKDVTKVTTKPRNYIKFFKGSGCYSQVGRQINQQTISIGERCIHHGVIVHEIGHAMGLWHEQSRPDRDNYVKINWNNIITDMQFNFKKYTTSKINSLGVAYDYKSVMHYGSTAFSKDGRSPTIEIKSNAQRTQFGQRQGLSDKDKQQVQLLYGCKGNLPCDPSPCLNGGRCSSQGITFKCSCRSGFTGARCEESVGACQDNYQQCPGWGNNGYCKKGSKFVNFMKRECCQTCQSSKTVSPCNSSPCLNAGRCSNQGTTFKCSCGAGFKGVRCEQKILPCGSSPCLNGGRCSNQATTFKCSCRTGFKGVRCEQKILPCDSSPCLNGGTCSNQGTSFKCSCRSSFTGVRCEQKTKSCTKDLVKSENCAHWKGLGYCKNSSKWARYMSHNCCFTCKPDCDDKRSYCKQWSDRGFCTGRYEKYMKANCAKSCGC